MCMSRTSVGTDQDYPHITEGMQTQKIHISERVL